MKFTSANNGEATSLLPYQERLIGNPETGALHSGAVTSLLDTTCGLAVVSAMSAPQALATLDLRIDFLAASSPGLELRARAECYKKTSDIAFVRAIAYHGDESNPIATCAATFMLRTDVPPALEREPT